MSVLRALTCTVLLLSAAAGAWAADCVEVELRAEKRTDTPVDALNLFYSMSNCGEQGGLADIVVTLEKDDASVGSVSVKRFLQPEHSFSNEWELPIPPVVPPGSYRLCLEVTLGEASDSACGSIEIDEAGNVLSFAADESVESAVESRPWTAIKRSYR